MCFAGDFGGYFGLFLGGSVMSVFEILDLVIYNSLVKLTTKRNRRKPNPEPIPQVVTVESAEDARY